MQFITATTSLSQCYLSLGNCLKLSNLRGSHLTDLNSKPPTHQDKGFGLLMYSLDLLQEHTLHWFLRAEGYRFCGAHGQPIATEVRNTVQRSTWPLKARAIEKYTWYYSKKDYAYCFYSMQTNTASSALLLNTVLGSSHWNWCQDPAAHFWVSQWAQVNKPAPSNE